MTRHPKANLVTGIYVVAAACALAIGGCSSSPSTGGFGGTGGDMSGNASSGSSSGGGSSSGQGQTASGSSTSSGSGTTSGSSSGGSSGSNGGSSGASSGTSSGASSSTGGGADSGAPLPSHGCGQGTSCTPGTDLAAPASTDGFQIVIPSTIVVQPGQEAYYCYYKTIPGNAAIEVGAFQSWMSTGSSHHFITFQGGSMADGTLQQCAIGTGNWVYATSVAGQVIELQMPAGVGLKMAAGTQLILNMHFVNPGTSPVTPSLKLNVLFGKNVQYQAGTMVSFNAAINVPAASAAGPGMQTVAGTCSAPVGSKFFAITTHTHKHATASLVNFISGGKSTTIVDTTDWESPDVGLWYAPNFLTVNSGDSFTYSCAYTNTGSVAVTVGETAAANEMCMAIGYYFPAGSAPCQ